MADPIEIGIPVSYNAAGAPARVKIPHDTTNSYKLVWKAKGEGITFGPGPSSPVFQWKTGSGQPAVAPDGTTKLVSDVYFNNGSSGSTWTYGVTVLKNGADPIFIDPEIQNEPPG